MTIYDWFRQAELHGDKLEKFIFDYHPKFTRPDENHDGNPLIIFRLAVRARAWEEAYAILFQSWFHVPEVDDPMRIVGMRECISLLDFIPDGVRK